MNVTALAGDVPDEMIQEILDTGFTHYRRVEDDMVGQVAILRAAALILCDLAMTDPEPMDGLEYWLGHLRDEAAGLIAWTRGDDTPVPATGITTSETITPERKS